VAGNLGLCVGAVADGRPIDVSDLHLAQARGIEIWVCFLGQKESVDAIGW